MKNLRKTITLLFLVLFSATEAFAQAKDGEATVTQGSTTTVAIGSAYQSTLNRSTGINYTWTASNSNITIQSRTNKTCTIKGNNPGTARLNYQCSYYIDGFYRTMNFYYDITVKSNTISVTRVAMTPESATMDIGQTLQLSATAYPTNATNRKLNWTTDNNNVASVSSNGLVTARGEGKVWIWARATDGSGSGNYCVITVNAPTIVSSISLSETEATMEIGETLALKASVLPENATNKSLKWTSGNAGVATVANGIITALAPGECDINCTSTDGSNISATCHVTVNKPIQHWLSVLLPNGTFAINVTDLETVELKVSPDPEYIVHSVTLDGVEQDIVPDETILTLPTLTKNAILNVVFESSDLSDNTDKLLDESSPLRLTVHGNTVTLKGLQHGETANIYSINGELIKSTANSTFTLNSSGVYIARIGHKTFKFAI